LDNYFSHKIISRGIVLALLLAFLISVSGTSQTFVIQNNDYELLLAEINNYEGEAICIPGNGWKWAYGEKQPIIANIIKEELEGINIYAVVNAQSFGEKDSCGNFRPYSIDVNIILDEISTSRYWNQDDLINKIIPILTKYCVPKLGKFQFSSSQNATEIKLIHPDDFTFLSFDSSSPIESSRDIINSNQIFLPLIYNNYRLTEIVKKKVYVIVYDPILSNGQFLSDYLNWWDHEMLTEGTINFFYESSRNSLMYEVTDFTLVTHEWPVKIDGFQYSEAEYLAAYLGDTSYHSPDEVDYNKIVNSPLFDICGKANRGEIDEVWIYNGPGFGFSESTLVGPNAYWYNSPPVPGENNCERLIPIMGPSPERHLDCAIHNFGHRAESTMMKVYGSWQQNSISHNWEKFALVDYLSPDFAYSGCGNIHYPPNGVRDYDYNNFSSVPSNCDAFFNYPNLGKLSDTISPVSCELWNCDDLGYLKYWFSHFPSYMGCTPDNISNNWWKYFSTPELALNPSLPCK